MPMFKIDVGNLTKSFFNFFKKLLTAHWRSLLLLFVGVYLPLQIFGLLALELWDEGGFLWDGLTLIGIHFTASAQLDNLATTLTLFGSWRFMFPFVSLTGVVFFFQKRWRSLIYLLTTMIGSATINRIAKEIMHRVRPNLWESPAPELSFSFPSGHAMMSMALVTTFVVLTWGTIWCAAVLIVGGLFVVSIAWTRLYLGVHFPSDILAGWMVSIAWAIGVSLIVRPHMTKETAVSEPPTAEETTLLPDET